MTYQETKKANTANASHAMLKLLQHLGREHGHHFHGYEQKAVEMLISGATCNESDDLLSEEYFDSLISEVIYKH
jgi:hypothetical protein